MLSGEIANSVARGLRVFQHDELPLGGEIQPVIERRQQRARGDDVRHARVILKAIVKPQRPRIAADIPD